MTEPRARRKPTKTADEALSPGMRRWLLTGRNWFEPECDIKAVWNEYRDELVAKWIEEHPGTRPWAWWEFDAPERRQRLDGPVHPHDNPDRPHGTLEDSIAYGLPVAYCCLDDWEAEYEAEPAYLERLELLADGEWERIPEEFFETDDDDETED